MTEDVTSTDGFSRSYTGIVIATDDPSAGIAVKVAFISLPLTLVVMFALFEPIIEFAYSDPAIVTDDAMSTSISFGLRTAVLSPKM